MLGGWLDRMVIVGGDAPHQVDKPEVVPAGPLVG